MAKEQARSIGDSHTAADALAKLQRQKSGAIIINHQDEAPQQLRGKPSKDENLYTDPDLIVTTTKKQRRIDAQQSLRPMIPADSCFGGMAVYRYSKSAYTNS